VSQAVSCVQAESFVHAYVDGELTGQDREAYERHLETCDSCRADGRFQGRFKASLRAHLPRPPVPTALERQIHVALAELTALPGRRPWSVALPAMTARRLAPLLAVAAGVVVIVGVGARGQHQPTIVEQLLRLTYRQAELPLDVVGTDCRSVAKWFQGRVDFPVHAPRLPAQFTCLGGRLVNVEARPAAYLVYQDPEGDRVAVLVFDPQAAPMESPQRRVVNGHDVYYRSDPGSSTAFYRDRDIGYGVTSVRDQESLIQLVSQTLH